MTRNPWLIGSAALSLALVACGGGGGGAQSTPPPPPSPTPSPTPSSSAITIFPNPAAQSFASAGVSAAHTGSGSTAGFGTLSNADADQVHIRYTNAGFYEIQMPGAAWEKLTIAKGVIPTDPGGGNDFQPQSAPQNGAYLVTSIARTLGYSYSELAAWSDGASRFGTVAFGPATAAGQVPVTGSATYSGIAGGSSDVVNSNSFDGSYLVPVSGSVALNFDFANGALGGAMTLALADYSSATIGTFAFKDTVFSVGSTAYSGKFATSVSGQNYFLGQFTGPNAEETIGAWALPFVFSNGSSTLSPDGKTHQAFGAWIAKKGP